MYWRMGFWNGMHWYLQEKKEGNQDDDTTLMIMWLDINWVIVEPAWGVTDSNVLARSDWPEMLSHCQENTDNKKRLNLGERWFFVPHDASEICRAIQLHHGQAWLNERLHAELAVQIEQQNALLAEKSTDEPQATSGAAGSETANFQGDEQDEQQQQHNPDKPKTGSLNHKCALIVAYERRDWERVEYLIAVLRVLVTIQYLYFHGLVISHVLVGHDFS